MAFLEMYQELTGAVPKMPVDYAKTLINRAYRDASRQSLWSYQLFEANWVSPAIINAGTVTTVQGANTVTFDATASTAITAVVLSSTFPTPLLQRQFRVGISTIYNIWAYEETGGIVTLTLDRPYTDASATGSPYSILQCYYPAPMEDWVTWINIRDIVNYVDLNVYATRKQFDLKDPQRSIYYLPTECAFYRTEPNPASPNFRWPVFELWGVPQYQLVYQLYGIRKGALLVTDDDLLPAALGEDCILALARVYAYEWAEAQKGDMPRNSGSDFKFLMGAANAEYKRLFREYRLKDREQVDNWYEVRRPGIRNWPPMNFNAIGNTANPGAPW